MQKRKKQKSVVPVICAVALVAVAAGIVTAVLPHEEETLSENSQTQQAAEIPEAEGETVLITFSENGISIGEDELPDSDNVVQIRQAGIYELRGGRENIQIYVEAGNEDMVELVLNGVELVNAAEPVIYVENAGQTILRLAGGSANYLQSGTTENENVQDEDVSGGAVYARDDLYLTGEGSLEIAGYLNNGIQTSNHLIIDGGTYLVTAANNGLKGKDSVTISGGEFDITAGNDGIQSDDTTGDGYGVIEISGGDFVIDAVGDGIQAETALNISGGGFTVTSGGGSGDAALSGSTGWGDADAGWDFEEEGSPSAKGFKSGTSMTLSGGTFTVDSLDDGFHSDGSITVTGGSFEIRSGDDGIHADTELLVEDGDILILQSYEGMEGNQITVSGGNIDITATDDGINAYGGRSLGWGGSSHTTEEMPNLIFSGGTVHINADGDGMDSNGNLIVEGGTVVVDGPESSWNGAIDSGSENGGECIVNGGTVLAIGASGMAETFDSGSRQYSFRHNFDRTFPAGSEVVILDSGGDTLLSHTSEKSFSSVVFSSPELLGGETYVLQAGDERVEITLNDISTISGQSPRWSW